VINDDNYIEIDMTEQCKKYNKAVEKTKLGFELVFPEPYGTIVYVKCMFYCHDLNKGRKNACVKDIVNQNNGLRYIDKNEKNESVNHMWLQNVYSDENSQKEIWLSLQQNDILFIKGILSYYGKDRKKAIVNPVIMQVFRNNQPIFPNHTA